MILNVIVLSEGFRFFFRISLSYDISDLVRIRFVVSTEENTKNKKLLA